MKKIIVGVLACTVAGAVAFLYLQQTDTSKTNTAEVETVTTTVSGTTALPSTNQPVAPIDDETNVSETDELDIEEFDIPEPVDLSMKERNDGPWNNDLEISYSTDGVNFNSTKVLVEGGGVPTMTRLNNGTLVLIFQWFPDTEWFDYPAAMTSTDNGQTWTDPTPIVLKNYPAAYSNPFDPTLVVTEEGTVRMYFTINPVVKVGSFDTQIRSAISEDGLTYEFEEGIRFTDSDHELTRDAVAVLIEDTWHLYSPDHEEMGRSNHGTSTDGLDFTEESDIYDSQQFNWLGNVINTTEGIRFYGTWNGEVAYKTTTDGFNWADPVQTNVLGADPGIIQAEDGTYIIVSTTVKQAGGGQQMDPLRDQPSKPSSGQPIEPTTPGRQVLPPL